MNRREGKQDHDGKEHPDEACTARIKVANRGWLLVSRIVHLPLSSQGRPSPARRHDEP